MIKKLIFTSVFFVCAVAGAASPAKVNLEVNGVESKYVDAINKLFLKLECSDATGRLSIKPGFAVTFMGKKVVAKNVNLNVLANNSDGVNYLSIFAIANIDGDGDTFGMGTVVCSAANE